MKYNVKRCVFSEIPTSNRAYDTVALYIYSAGSHKKQSFSSFADIAKCVFLGWHRTFRGEVALFLTSEI